MAVKMATLPSWKESHTLLGHRDDLTPATTPSRPRAGRAKALFLDMGLCCCVRGDVVDSPGERQLLGHSPWSVTGQDGPSARESSVLLSRSASVRAARARDGRDGESWFSQAFGGNKLRKREEGKGEQKRAWDGAAVEKTFHLQQRVERGPRTAKVETRAQFGSFRAYNVGHSGPLPRSASTKKRAHDVIYSGNAKWKKILRRLLNDLKKIHLPAVHIDGPYNYDTLNYLKNFDVCEDDDRRTLFRSLSTASGHRLKSQLAAEMAVTKCDEDIVEESSPVRKAARQRRSSDEAGVASLYEKSASASMGSEAELGGQESAGSIWERRAVSRPSMLETGVVKVAKTSSSSSAEIAELFVVAQ